ncbi:MAG: transposase [Candidatus Kapaibacterium sp.]|nr:MAG: transposase [Candidatus Kapabacteria bacterium]
MKITAKILLQTTPEQAKALRQTLELGNKICDHISEKAWSEQVFTPFKLQKIVYHPVKTLFPITAQMIIRLIAKVADAYTLDKKTMRTFRKHGAIGYDSRILRYYTEKHFVSIWTTKGRMKIPYIVNEHNAKLMETQQGESDLVYRNGNFFLFATCNVEEPPPHEFNDILGVDFGIVNIASDSDGNTFSGERLETNRQWYAERRAALQSVGTKSAKRRLKQLSGRQKRFQQNENHIIAKTLVAKAKGTKRALALEDLTGIRKRTTETIRHEQRAKHSNWAFFQLKQFVAYKAKRA